MVQIKINSMKVDGQSESCVSMLTMLSSGTVRPSRLVTVGERSVASAGPQLWNTPPDDIITASCTDSVSTRTENIYFGSHIWDIIL